MSTEITNARFPVSKWNFLARDLLHASRSGRSHRTSVFGTERDASALWRAFESGEDDGTQNLTPKAPDGSRRMFISTAAPQPASDWLFTESRATQTGDAMLGSKHGSW